MSINTRFSPVGRWLRALVGISWLGFVSAGLSGATHKSFIAVFSAVACGAAFSGFVLLWCMTRWALRSDARSGQFSTATLLVTILLASLYFAAIRWLVVHTSPGAIASPEASAVFVMVAVYCMLQVLISIPFVLGVLDGIVWLSVWIARRPVVQHLVKHSRIPPG